MVFEWKHYDSLQTQDHVIIMAVHYIFLWQNTSLSGHIMAIFLHDAKLMADICSWQMMILWCPLQIVDATLYWNLYKPRKN